MKLRYILLFLSLAIFCGCLDQKTESAPTQNTSQGEQNSVEPDVEKWNSYVDLNNNIEISFHNAVNSYFDAFGAGSEYSPATDSRLTTAFLQEMSQPDNLTKAIEAALAASAKEPQSELDVAVNELGIYLKALWGGLVDCRDYYADPSFSDENNSRAISLHSTVYESYQKLNAAYSRFRDIINKAGSERRKHDIETLRAQGHATRAAMLAVVDKAQILQDYFHSRDINSTTLPSLDLQDFLPVYIEFAKTADEFEQVLKKDGRRKEKIAQEALESYSAQVTNVRQSAASIIESFRNKTRFQSDQSDVSTTLGTPENFNHELGRLVDIYNSCL